MNLEKKEKFDDKKKERKVVQIEMIQLFNGLVFCCR